MIKFLPLGKKEPEVVKIGKGYVPTDRVRQLSSKGFSETEIIDVLRKEGFSAEEIDRGLTQALQIGVTGEPEEAQALPTLQDLQMQATEPAYAEPFVQEEPKPAQPAQQQPTYQQEYYPQESYGAEELVEAIVQERMIELDERLSEFKEKYSSLERKINDLHNRLSVMTKGGSQREEVLINKIETLKDSMDDIDAKLSGLDKTFKDVLPALIESVRSLADLVQRLKREA